VSCIKINLTALIFLKTLENRSAAKVLYKLRALQHIDCITMHLAADDGGFMNRIIEGFRFPMGSLEFFIGLNLCPWGRLSL
jgi:hypothetical protein